MSRQSAQKRALVAAVLAALRGLGSEIDQLDALAASRFAVNRTDLRGLELLSAGPLSPTQLADALGMTTGGVTTVIDRLQRAGYARRTADPHDRRKVLVEPTRLLKSREGEIFGGLLEHTEALIASYSEIQLETIRDFLERSRAVMGAQRERVAPVRPTRA